MQAAYPIHPELFDRLYNDWSSLDRFQRTRGVLRLMASVIHALWERNDGSLLIMPATIPIDEPDVQKELTRYLEDNWVPVMEKDVDGPASLPLAWTAATPTSAAIPPAGALARTIYMGSAPTYKANNRGIDDRGIKLGCVQPGETVATFGDALRRLTDQATHLYVDRSRYWYSTQPSVTRLAQDRAAQIDVADAWEELKRRLRSDRQRGDFAAVHVVPAAPADIPDEPDARLVVLGPETPHVRRSTIGLASQQANMILKQRGNSPRLNQNMLVFLAPDETRLGELEEGIRQYMAWKSIYEERETLNLDPFQTNQAKSKLEAADETVDARIHETYVWLLVPYQSDPRDPNTLTLEEHRIQGKDPLAVLCSRRLISTEGLFTVFGGVRLKMELDKLNLLQEKDHIKLEQLWDYFARYLYLPRLRDDGVSHCRRAGWRQPAHLAGPFAYASAYDEEPALSWSAGGRSRLHRSTARACWCVQTWRNNRLMSQQRLDPLSNRLQSTSGGDKPGPTPPPPKPQAKHFYGTVELDPMTAPAAMRRR